MPKRSKKSQQWIHPNAAGIDVGSRELYVAVPEDRDERPVQRFGVMTRDLKAMVQWLLECGIEEVVMESTGVYWITPAQMLEANGIDFCLVDARHVKNVPGRKSDVSDARWLQYLHSVGLLQGAFRPKDSVVKIRTLMRHRESLVEEAGRQIQRMQKALTQMNLRLHHLLRDLSGVSGMRILEAIESGERDPEVLADLCSPNVKASREEIVASLEGDWREEHLFVLFQALEHYRFCRRQIESCEGKIQEYLEAFEEEKSSRKIEHTSISKRKESKNDYSFDMRSYLHGIFGVDLTAIPGISAPTAFVLFAELGNDFDAFGNSKRFCSWLGLAPHNKITGGKILSSRTLPTKNRAGKALRLAAYGVMNSHSFLGDYYRKMRARLGPAQAITATAHKLARIVYTLVQNQIEYNESVFQAAQQLQEERRRKRILKEARKMGLLLVEEREVS